MRSRSLVAPVVVASLAGLTLAGCLERPIARQEPRSTAVVVEPLKLSAVERIDLLLAIDNSASMGDKQEILARAVPDLVKRLANPYCVDASGARADDQPQSPTASCPPGSEREFIAVPDIHVGIVSSSLGGIENGYCDLETDNDRAHLLARKENGAAAPTYEGHGFLAWDPDKKLDPPGETVLDAGTSGLVPQLQDMVRGVGEGGCGFEGQLESWYRFLIQPDPYEKLVQNGSALVPKGIDATILEQRKQFLRPDSLVAIIMLSDENDCSIEPSDSAAKIYSRRAMARPRSECETNAAAHCCAPCDDAPSDCAPDPSCTDGNGEILRLSGKEDPSGLRCFNQKQRFGKDYLYPIERYVKGLSELQVPARDGTLAANPLFLDLDKEDALHGPRPASLVFLAGIVGVPWQDISRDPLTLTKGLKNAKELSERNIDGQSAWDVILGNRAKGIAPLDPHMREDTAPRSGENPVTGTSMFGPDAGPNADPISGHERGELTDSLQYACTFPLLTPITSSDNDCQNAAAPDDKEKDPLCQDASGSYSTTQLYGKAFPATRELEVLQGFGEQAIVASVCPANMDEKTEDTAAGADFGYRPAVSALIERLKGKLGHKCLPRKLTPDKNNQVTCLVVEARKSESCSCKAEDGRVAVEEEHLPAIVGARDSGIIDDRDDCFCEIPQLGGDELAACQNEKADPLVIDGDQVDGWCYIDASSVPKVGSAALVPESCASTERRLIRLVGNAKARAGSTLFTMCSEG